MQRTYSPFYLFLLGCRAAGMAIVLLCALTASAQESEPVSTEQGCPYTIPDQTVSGDVGKQTSSLPRAMTAEEIIGILKQDVPSLSDYKSIAGQRYAVDPSTISDERFYLCIRADRGLRTEITTTLRNQGYQVNQTFLPSDAGQNRDVSDSDRRDDADRREDVDPRGYIDRADESRKNKDTLDQDTNKTEEPQKNKKSLGPPQQFMENERVREMEETIRDKRIRKTPPYLNLPSLVDLYTQDTPATGPLKRFGSDAFRPGMVGQNPVPIDLPVGPDYVLGPGDNLVLNLWGGQSQRLDRTIDRQGKIALPEAGTVALTGLTMAEATTVIGHALATQFRDEKVDLTLGRVRTVRVYVTGEVQRPGGYDVSSLSTVLNVLLAAGGPTVRGSMRRLRQMRGEQLVREIDLYDLLLHGVRADHERLLPGDTILVPPVGPQVSIRGMVQRPAIYELRGERALNQVLMLAGGALVSAAPKIRVERVVAHQARTMLEVTAEDGKEVDSKLTGFVVQDGDQITVFPVLPYNSKSVYLQGHVFRPGAYGWSEGMTVSDLLASYRDVMPEPAAHAEIVRLVPPDLRPRTISFDLIAMLAGGEALRLEPFDMVRIYGRYEIDPPKVSIHGEVLRPGEYPMSEGMTVADLVRMAGGFRRSAYREQAELTSYQVLEGRLVMTDHMTVAINRALNGDREADKMLKPGDMVGVHKLTNWQDIGASITISGEVAYSGTYGIQEGERLSSVLRRAGGFNAQAYPLGAVLNRVEIRTQEENSRQAMIQRIQSTIPSVSVGVSGSLQDQQNLLQSMRLQQQDVLAALRSRTSAGRLVIRISSDIAQWANTSADIELRAGDTLRIPKRPEFVLVSGQVYNSTGITFESGKNVRWYLKQAGGVTRYGDRKSIFIVRADGSVATQGKSFLMRGSTMDIRMYPGDSIVVPEKVQGGSQVWRSLMATAQLMSSVALTGAVSGVF